MFQILIQGYEGEASNGDVISLLVKYTEGEIRLGDTIRLGNPDPIDLIVTEITLGTGNGVTRVPVGNQSILLARGKVEDLNLLKSVIGKISGWKQNNGYTSATVISKI